jgi:hypothetical protein
MFVAWRPSCGAGGGVHCGCRLRSYSSCRACYAKEPKALTEIEGYHHEYS